MNRAPVALLAAALLLPSAAASSVHIVKTDPRFELLGVVAELAGRSYPEAPEEYRALVRKRFKKFAEHPAVLLYHDLAADPGAEEASATLPMYYTDPPELALKDPNADIHYLSGERRSPELHRLLQELRSFAAESDFMGFYRSQAARYAQREEEARAQFAGLDPVRVMEAYTGLDFATTAYLILTPLAPVTHAFISPYPLPPANLGSKQFETYTVPVGGELTTHAWSEPSFIFVDPAYHYFERLNIKDPKAFYGAEMAACRHESPDCVKHLISAALTRRLEGLSCRPDKGLMFRHAFEARYFTALCERLQEYEGARAKYPTLWTFLPRLFSVFYEGAHGGAAPKPFPSVPADPDIRATADFFDPIVVGKLNR